MSTTDHRLPTSVVPEHYDLTLHPDLGAATFTGEERVTLQVLEPVSEIVLNALDLEVHTAELVAADGRQRTATVDMDEGAEQATLTLDGVADPGEWVLHLTFEGTLNDKLRGFYRSTFVDAAGTEQVIATTQFEATDARRAFPCWDEPAAKATFDITLIVDADLLAVSNAPIVEEDDLGNGTKQVRFATTMKMSTYLVAFVVGPLVAVPPVDVDGVPLGVISVPGKEHLSAFALDIGAHALRFFTAYFGIPYPAEKLDLVALPDFAFGAMENLGCVTFRESLLLIDPEQATRVELERAADVVAHEIAHMWFGDLVTMKWWNGIWLNEAFATFMELLCIDDYRPQWDRWVSFGLTRGVAMGIDSLNTTRPIEFPVVAPSEADAMFDTLTYQKGAGVLRMLERYIGADPFRQGIVRYIATHQYGNTETTDLWDAIEAATGEPARSIMDSWIYQGGHPVISVEASADGTTLTLSQKRFRFLAQGDDGGGVWEVPILLRAGVGGEVVHHRLVLDGTPATIELGGGKIDWVVVNEGGWGVYRVRYGSELLRAITADLGRLDALERFALLSDTWAAVVAGLSPVTDFVELVGLYGAETDPNIWAVVLGGLDTLERAAPDQPTKDEVRAFVRQLVGPALERVGWEPADGEDETVRTLRATLIRAMGGLGADVAVRARAAGLFEALGQEGAGVDPDVAAAVVAVVAAVGGEESYTAFLARWRAGRTPQEELRYLYGLAAFEHPALVRRTLELAATDVRTQNAPFVFSLTLANRAGGPLAWAFLKERWDEVLEKMPDNLLDRMLDGVATFTDPAVAADVHAWIDAHPAASRAKIIEQLLERLDVNVAFAQRAAQDITAAFPRG